LAVSNGGFVTVIRVSAPVLQVERCVALLSEAGRLPEAAMLARTYKPSIMSGPVKVRGGSAYIATHLIPYWTYL
jgi:hypothetical protein